MVDVSEKKVTTRRARARSRVQLPVEVAPYFRGEELHLKKGPVFQTAIIAGTMAVKKTWDLIPFCHAIPIEACRFHITMNESLLVTIECEVKTTGKTGVEMEALHGAMSAALTIYDMCKALSHDIVIRETKLIGKTGGKRTVLDRPLYGLILTGGKSERMGTDKALLDYRGKPHAIYLREMLAPYCEEVFLSARAGQWKNTPLEQIPTIEDSIQSSGPNSSSGPIAGILSAFALHPDAYWFVVACDLPNVTSSMVEEIIDRQELAAVATVFRNAEDDFPEALFGLYSPLARAEFLKASQADVRCPVKVLRLAGVKGVAQSGTGDLANINTPEERAHL